jgi:hypothetical protein
VRFPAAEVEAAAWFPLDEIEAWLAARPQDFAAGFIACWQAARARGPRPVADNQ